jgi:hypothetical protein
MMDGSEIRFFSALQPAMNCALQVHSFIFLVNDKRYVLLFLATSVSWILHLNNEITGFHITSCSGK